MYGFSSKTFIERWHRLSLTEQLGNIGSEVECTIIWKKKGNAQLATKALYRSLDLLNLTISDPRWHDGKLKELTRVREVLCDTFVGDNVYNTPPEVFQQVLLSFRTCSSEEQGQVRT